MNGFKDLNLTIFELMSYIFPGLLVIVLVSVFTASGLELATNNLLITFFVSYIIGNILHTFSNDFALKGMGWKLYHFCKEKDNGGHGVTEPKTMSGKFAHWFRYHVLQRKLPKRMNVKKLIDDKYKKVALEPFDYYYIKEVILAKQPDVSASYQHLQYQRIFNNSLFVVFLLSTPAVLLVDYLIVLKFTINPTLAFNIDGSANILALASLFLALIFYKRARFFKEYRDKLLDATLLVYLEA